MEYMSIPYSSLKSFKKGIALVVQVSPEVTRFDQKNHEDRWSKTVYGEGLAKTTAQDPRDPDDTILDPIHTDEADKEQD
jgi:hypothetical protein